MMEEECEKKKSQEVISGDGGTLLLLTLHYGYYAYFTAGASGLAMLSRIAVSA